MNLGETAIYAAAASGRLPVCQLLLRNGSQVSTRNSTEVEKSLIESNPLNIAIKEGHYSIVELFLNHLIGPPPAGNSRNTTSDSADSISLVVEPCDNLGRSPLSVAAAEGQVGVMELLLSKNADIEFKNKEDGISPLTWAVIGMLYLYSK